MGVLPRYRPSLKAQNVSGKLKMRTRFIIIIGTLFLFAFSSKTNIDWTIVPGSGFDSIQIGHSTISDIQKILGEGNVKSTTWYYDCVRPNGKKKHKVKTLEYDSLGLTFNFEDEKIKNSKLKSIKFKPKRNWQTSNNLTINKSTRKDVYDALGNPNYEHNCVGFLTFENEGISFLFKCNEKFKDNINDTIIEILVEPKRQQK